MTSIAKNIFFWFHGNEYRAEVIVDFHTDPYHGADRNGHRGMPRDMLDDIVIQDVFDAEENTVVPSESMKDIISREAWA